MQKHGRHLPKMIFVLWVVYAVALIAVVTSTLSKAHALDVRPMTIPAVPSNLIAVPEGSDGVRVSWNPSSGALNYDVWRWDYYAGSSGAFAPYVTATVSTTLKDVIGCGETQFYQVRARSVDGVSDFTGWVEVKASPCLAYPSNLALSVVSTDTFRLTWNAVPGVLGYKLYRWNPDVVQFQHVATFSNTVLVYNDVVGCGQVGFYEISSYSAVTESAISPWATGETPACTTGAVPETPALVFSGASPSSITMSWEAVGSAENYLIYKKINESFLLYSSTSGGILSFTDADLQCGTIQSYKISARNVYGESPLSSSLDVTTLGCVPVIGSLKTYVSFAVR